MSKKYTLFIEQQLISNEILFIKHNLLLRPRGLMIPVEISQHCTMYSYYMCYSIDTYFNVSYDIRFVLQTIFK